MNKNFFAMFIQKKIRTTFVINKDYDAFQIWASFHFAHEDSFLSLNNSFGLDKSIGMQIRRSKDYKDCAYLIDNFVSEKYKKNEHLLEQAVESYSIEWQKVNDIFYDLVVDITGYDWEFQEYEVIMSLFHTGISNRNANYVLRSAYEDAKGQTRITAHEILMTQIWYIFGKVFGKKSVSRNEDFFWSANEITTTAMLGLESKLDALWPDNQKGFDNFLLNYSNMSELRDAFEKAYINKQSFGGYLKYIESFLRRKI
ncbi:MAG: hypothetical protein COZ27_03500 [Candidatus Moranbacteria bacterium CG_4_10_14_3_um_filter_41_65]|nr:MAG: hypothetical protein AUK58_04225 [Candidatus Moranbacteria bacterium CG2_30_41_165]PIW93874.1 MAG: hypothetical protein COZ86_03920 [Candidatus Moranbacteria bacterium CG_4_8_14_3_um_filter_41_13]PIX91308.1 MAG: hypothetical protein COZ27_03500 [Candidatus Moranbacteria bacterium CG_4_10_14_3_um_filter_41_65]